MTVGIAFLGWCCWSEGLAPLGLGEDDAVLGGGCSSIRDRPPGACHCSPAAAPTAVRAMLGTLMVLNVYFVISPAKREMVKARRKAAGPIRRYGAMGRRVGAHTPFTYLCVHDDQQPYAGSTATSGTGSADPDPVSGALIRVWFGSATRGNANPLGLAAGLCAGAEAPLACRARRRISARPQLCRGSAILQAR